MASAVVTDECSVGSIPTVIRIKRRLVEESPATIVVSAKRKKLDSNIPAQDETVFTKVATVKQEEKIGPHLQKILKNDTKRSVKLRESYKKVLSSNFKDKVRKRVKSNRAGNFFKLTCSKRNLILDSDDIDFNFFDASEENILSSFQEVSTKSDVITCNGEPMKSEKMDFVYDLYYSDAPIDNVDWIDNICEIRKQDLDFIYEDRSDEDSVPESDDENDEDNYRNDYPEEEEEDGDAEDLVFGDYDDYLCHRMKKVTIGDSDESYDAADYDYSGDFDEDGKQICGIQNNILRRLTKGARLDDDSSSSNED